MSEAIKVGLAKQKQQCRLSIHGIQQHNQFITTLQGCSVGEVGVTVAGTVGGEIGSWLLSGL